MTDGSKFCSSTCRAGSSLLGLGFSPSLDLFPKTKHREVCAKLGDEPALNHRDNKGPALQINIE